MMDDLRRVLPPGPARVPPGLTDAPPTYRRHAWLAVCGLGAFALAYVALTGYLAWAAVRLLRGLDFEFGALVPALLLSLPALFLFLFMLRALFFVRRGGTEQLVEVTPEEEPLLFAFIHRIADGAGAPRPHRVS